MTTLKSGKSNVFICTERERVCVCLCDCARVCLFGFVCHMQCAREGSLEHIGVRTIIVVNNSSKRIQRWQL